MYADGIGVYGTEGTTSRNRFPETTNVVTNIHAERALLSTTLKYSIWYNGGTERAAVRKFHLYESYQCWFRRPFKCDAWSSELFLFMGLNT